MSIDQNGILPFIAKSSEYSGSYFSLPDVITIFFFAIVVGLLFKKINLSPVIGYIVAGAIIGPFGLGLTGYNHVTKSLAEFGVVFLLFAIGLELTIERLLAMRRLIFGLSLLQFTITSILFYIISYIITSDVILSFIISTGLTLSSTAIVLKILSETHQANTNTGRISLSILLFQDLAVIPIFILIPYLAQDNNYNVSSDILFIIFKSLSALTIIIIAGRYLLRPILRIIASSGHNDLFIAATLLIVLSASWITNQMGLSLALGAFIAGLMIAETEYQHKTTSIISPFKGLFLGLFFITEIGMHFDVRLILQYFIPITLSALLLIIIKTLITYYICRLLKYKSSISLNTALLVSQAGEFAFIIFNLATRHNFMEENLFQYLSLIVGLSMALTPILAILGQKLENKIDMKNTGNIDNIPSVNNQIVIIGFDRVGQTIADILTLEKANFIILDNNTNIVTKFYNKGYPIFYSNKIDKTTLQSLKINNQSTIIWTLDDHKLQSKTMKLILKHYPDVMIITRANGRDHVKSLEDIGAKIIIPEIQELGLQMSKKALSLIGVREDQINHTLREYRNSQFID